MPFNEVSDISSGYSNYVGCPHEHDGYHPSYVRELHILVRGSCTRCERTIWPDVSRHGFAMSCHSLFCSIGGRVRLDGWIILERVLCHCLESPPRLPAPAACTPLETNQHPDTMERTRPTENGRGNYFKYNASLTGRPKSVRRRERSLFPSPGGHKVDRLHPSRTHTLPSNASNNGG